VAAHGKRGRRGGAVEHENEERWLLTYADMLTLLFALFMVLFSISSVNISKYQVLQQSLKAAFSGSILPGGRAILQSGSESTSAHTPATAEVPSIVPLVPTPTSRSSSSTGSANNAAAQPMTSAQLQAALNSMSASISEQDTFEKLKEQMDAYAKAHGFGDKVQTIIERRGLVVRVLTDNLLFDSGSATLQPGADQLLNEVAQLLNLDKSHPITVEGDTDNQPIHNAQFPSNWELSTARATNVVRYLITRDVGAYRLGAVGYADLHPIASNATPAGRAQNRRVEVVLMRLNPVPPS
jgi:chemotaxis protein MotB